MRGVRVSLQSDSVSVVSAKSLSSMRGVRVSLQSVSVSVVSAKSL